MFTVNDKVHRNVLLSCDHGLMIVNRFDDNAENVGHGRWLLDHGNVSTMEASICFGAIRDQVNPVIFDIGANIGTFTTWLSRAFPQGKIYCMEPQRQVFQMLCGNLAINNLFNVYAYNLALGKENTMVEFEEPNYFQNADFGTFSMVDRIIKSTTNDKIRVDVLTLDDFLSRYGVDRVSLLKIDAEGMDLEVLMGATRSIDQHRPVIFIEHSDNRRSILDDIKSFLDRFDYKYTIHGNNVLCIQQ